MNNPDCYKCKHRGTVAGDAHSCCKYPGTKTGILDFFAQENIELQTKLRVRGNGHGIRSGWFMWPVNFDPTWLKQCDGFELKPTQ